MATVKQQVENVLLGSSEEPQLSQQSKNVFMQHAVKDEVTGEHYLGEEEFVNAIAPQSEDYVSAPA